MSGAVIGFIAFSQAAVGLLWLRILGYHPSADKPSKDEPR
jgi:hypothetical protein